MTDKFTPAPKGYISAYVCRECGEPWSHKAWNGWTEHNKPYCFQCDYWLRLVKDANQWNSIRHDHIHRQAAWEGVHKGALRGFGGQVFFYEFFDGRLLRSNNVWNQGEIPERFHDRLPDNCREIKGIVWAQKALAQEKRLLSSLKDTLIKNPTLNGDIYTELAKEVFQRDDISPLVRVWTKTQVYALLYGSGLLSEELKSEFEDVLRPGGSDSPSEPW